MSCPRCGLADAPGPVCPRCGVVFAKIRERPQPAPATRPAAEEPSSSPGASVVRVALLLALVAATAAVSWQLGRLAELKAPSPTRPPSAAPPSLPPPPTLSTGLLPNRTPVRDIPSAAAAASDPDLALAQDLAHRLSLRATMGPADVAAAEGLKARHPLEPATTELLVSTLVSTAEQDRAARRFPTAIASLRRAVSLDPAQLPTRLYLMHLLLEDSDWAGAEAAARDALQLAPQNGEVLEGLGDALFRQDRNREAAEVLHHALDVRPTDTARALLARIEKGLVDERGMTEQHLSHFDVRYDGDAHVEVGREILRVLERHYATLTGTFDHQPSVKVAVILFTRQGYYNASGAPAWSGGVFDQTDGRIRIPVGGLTSSLSPEMEGVLIHELTHAFIHDMGRGAAPHELHEGVAQYMEGKRVASMLNPAQMTALADGRLGGVGGFYLGALSFAEYLMAQRGQGGLNDLLRAMGTTGSADEAFRQVYGHDFQGTTQAWRDRIRLQNGS